MEKMGKTKSFYSWYYQNQGLHLVKGKYYYNINTTEAIEIHYLAFSNAIIIISKAERLSNIPFYIKILVIVFWSAYFLKCHFFPEKETVFIEKITSICFNMHSIH